MQGRKYTNGTEYRYGFNGKENDNEVKGDGNQQDYGMRAYEPRLGRLMSIDPLEKQYPYYTPYQFAGNKPTKYIDRLGAQEEKSWYDYDINDLMNWISKPSNPMQTDGFVHKFSSSFNRNLNPIYYTYVTITGQDPVSSDFQKMGRMDAAAGLTTMIILHKSFGVATRMTATEALAAQGTKNAAAMGSTSAVKTVLNNEASATASGSKEAIQAVEENGFAIARDVTGNEAGRAFLTNGELNTIIKTNGTALKGRGADVFRTLYDFVNTNFDKVTSIRGTWRAGKMGDNLKTFNKLVAEGASEKEAALGTYTGKMAERLNFKTPTVTVNSRDANGVATSVDVIFKK